MTRSSGILQRRDSTFDKIFAHYINPEKFPLSDKEEEIRKRWSAAFSLQLNYHSPEQAVPVLMEEFSISKAQAYRDIRNATALFGDVHKSEKEGKRYILYEYSMKLMQMAIKKGDLEAWGRAIDKMIKLGMLDKEDTEQINPEKLEASEFKLVLPKELKQALMDMIGQGYIDLSQTHTLDIPHEELGNAEEEDTA